MINLIKWIIFYFIFTILLLFLSPKQPSKTICDCLAELPTWNGISVQDNPVVLSCRVFQWCARQFNWIVLPKDLCGSKTILLSCLAESLTFCKTIQLSCLAECKKVCKTISNCLAVCSVCLSDKEIVIPSLLIVFLTWLKLGRQSVIVFPCLDLSCPSLDCHTLLVFVLSCVCLACTMLCL